MSIILRVKVPKRQEDQSEKALKVEKLKPRDPSVRCSTYSGFRSSGPAILIQAQQIARQGGKKRDIFLEEFGPLKNSVPLLKRPSWE